MKVQLIYLIFFMVGVITAVVVASHIAKAFAGDNVTIQHNSSPKHITPQVKDDDGEEQTDKINREGDKAAESSKKCDAACEKEKAAQEDYIEDKKTDEQLAKEDAKNGNDLTVILKLKYSLPGKWYKNVRLDIDEQYSKKYDLSKQPSQIKVKHLEIAQGHSFKVSLNNYGSDEGESFYMHNSVCKCPEVKSVKVP